MASYEQREGGWSVRFYASDQTGARKQVRLSGYRTKKLAQAAYEQYVAQARAAEEAGKAAALNAPGEIRFDDLLASYMRYEKGRVKPSTYYDLESKINNRLAGFFSGKKMKDIKPLTVQEWVSDLQAKSYSFSSIDWIFSQLVTVYRYGNRYYDIPNIMEKVDKPRNLEPKKEMSYWTPEEFFRFFDCIKTSTHRAFFFTLYYTGCRRGEASALTWDDIDLENGVVHINKSLTHKVHGKPYEITTTKTRAGTRDVATGQAFNDFMRKYRTELENAGKVGNFVFCGTSTETPLSGTAQDNAFRKAIADSGVKRIRIHDLRHSNASYLIAAGVDIVTVSRRLGHENIEQTLNTYAHLLPDGQRKALDALEKINKTNL